MRRTQKYRQPQLVAYIQAEVDRLKATLGHITDGRVLTYGGGAGQPVGTTPPGPSASAHVLYGSLHTRSLHVTAGTGLNAAFEEGHVRIDETYSLVAAGTIALTNTSTNYVYVDYTGVVAKNTAGFPANCVPLAEVVTAGGVVTTVTDRRAYLWGHHGPSFVGTVKVDVLAEYTPNAGVTIDGSKIKDGYVYPVSGDPALWLGFEAADANLPELHFDSNDYIRYIRDVDTGRIVIGGAFLMVWSPTGILFPTGDVEISGTLIFDADANLYRSAAHVLKTDDAFHAVLGLVADTVAELTPDAGVTVDGCLVKDGRAALALGLRETSGPTDLVVGAITDGEYLKRVGATIVSAAGGGGVTDHGALTGLGDDDHAQYLLLAGRTGGQVAYGGTGAGDDLVLYGTSHATKGCVVLPERGLTIGTSAPTDNTRFGVNVSPTMTSVGINAGDVVGLGLSPTYVGSTWGVNNPEGWGLIVFTKTGDTEEDGKGLSYLVSAQIESFVGNLKAGNTMALVEAGEFVCGFYGAAATGTIADARTVVIRAPARYGGAAAGAITNAVTLVLENPTLGGTVNRLLEFRPNLLGTPLGYFRVSSGLLYLQMAGKAAFGTGALTANMGLTNGIYVISAGPQARFEASADGAQVVFEYMAWNQIGIFRTYKKAATDTRLKWDLGLSDAAQVASQNPDYLLSRYTGAVGAEVQDHVLRVVNADGSVSFYHDLRAAGYGCIGSVSAPTNVTAGDLTATRLSLGNAALAAGQVVYIYNASVANASATNGLIVANFTPTANGAYDMRGLEVQARYYGAFNNTSNIYGAVFSVSVGGTGKVNYLAAIYGIGLHLRTGAGAAMAVGDARALSFQLVYGSGRAAGETATIDVLTGVRIDSGYSTLIAGDVVTNAYGIFMQNMGNAAVTNAYGIYIAAVTGAVTTNIGIDIGACTQFDIRAAGKVVIGSYLRVGAVTAPTNVTAGDLTALRMMLGTDEALGVSVLLNLNSTTGAPLLPRMTTVQKAALTPVAGMVLYDATLGRFAAYDGAWKQVLLVGTPADFTLSNVTEDLTLDADVTTIDHLADVVGTVIQKLIDLKAFQ